MFQFRCALVLLILWSLPRESLYAVLLSLEMQLMLLSLVVRIFENIKDYSLSLRKPRVR